MQMVRQSRKENTVLIVFVLHFRHITNRIQLHCRFFWLYLIPTVNGKNNHPYDKKNNSDCTKVCGILFNIQELI